MGRLDRVRVAMSILSLSIVRIFPDVAQQQCLYLQYTDISSSEWFDLTSLDCLFLFAKD